MKKLLIAFGVFCALLFFTTCRKLDRDNPLDEKNPNADPSNFAPKAAKLLYSRTEVISDNNEDRAINKGEDVKLKVYLKNVGNLAATNVVAKITSSSPYFSIQTPLSAVAFNELGSSANSYIEPNSEGYPKFSDLLSIRVSTAVPDGASGTLTLTISDGVNNSWQDTFSLKVVKTGGNIIFNRADIYSDDNNNKVINPGENIKLKIYLKNNGTSKVNKLRAAISCTSSAISALVPNVPVIYSYLGSTTTDYIDKGDEGYTSLTNYVGFKVSSSAPTGTVLAFKIVTMDETTSSWTDTFTLTVN